MSKPRRRTSTERIEARVERSDLRFVRAAMVRAQQAHEELIRARFWMRLAAEPPAITERSSP